MLKYRTEFVVTGRGVFPVDMMRYDRCTPVSPQDVANLVLNGHTLSSIERDRMRRVRMMSYHASKHNPPCTPERWASFGWTVEEGSISTVRL